MAPPAAPSPMGYPTAIGDAAGAVAAASPRRMDVAHASPRHSVHPLTAAAAAAGPLPMGRADASHHAHGAAGASTAAGLAQQQQLLLLQHAAGVAAPDVQMQAAHPQLQDQGAAGAPADPRRGSQDAVENPSMDLERLWSGQWSGGPGSV